MLLFLYFTAFHLTPMGPLFGIFRSIQLFLLEPPDLNLQYFNYATLWRYLPKNSPYFTPWLMHPHLNKGLWQWFSCFLYCRIIVQVEINRIASTIASVYFNMISTLLILLFRAFYRYSVIWTPIRLVFMKFGNLSIYKIWNIQASSLALAPYSKCFGTTHYLKGIFT